MIIMGCVKEPDCVFTCSGSCIQKPKSTNRWTKCEAFYENGSGSPLVHDAFAEWGSILGIKFKHGKNPQINKPDILVRFETFDLEDKVIKEFIEEHNCQPLARKRNIPQLAEYVIELNTKANWNGRNPTQNCPSIDLKLGVIHEIGHILGLGHSSDPSDLMHCYFKNQMGLTPNDESRAISLLRDINNLLPCPIDLNGKWKASGYQCGPGTNFIEDLEIQHDINGGTIIATKLTGDNCVTAGNITFQGQYSDDFFHVLFTVGSPQQPNCCTTDGSITIVNPNKLFGQIDLSNPQLISIERIQ